MHHYSRVKTAAGPFWVGCSPAGITMIGLAGSSAEDFESAYRQRFGIQPHPGRIPESYARSIREAAAGREAEPVPIDLSSLTEFQRTVLNALRKVPRGEVRTYRELAAMAGRPKAVRAVGNTMARNPIPFLIPCHRIVPSTGGVGRYGLGTAVKRKLLVQEGVQLARGKLLRKQVRHGSHGFHRENPVF